MKTLFISCTKKTIKESVNLPICKSLDKMNISKEDRWIMFDNKEGLSTQYNKGIEHAIVEGYDCIVLVHDDVFLRDTFWEETIQKSFTDNYDVLGVAGACSLSVKNGLNNKKIAWHTCAKDANDLSGFALHPNKDNMYIQSSFGPTPKGVMTLDGLILILKVESFKNGKVRFDEDFDFDFYDFTFCIRCNQNNLRLSTIPLSVLHMSTGAGILNEKYDKLQEIFIEKYCM